jgi:pimeloyl-ACP methyl ester carboxylesterase
MTASGNPQLEGTVSLPDGRALAYSEWGHPKGKPVLLLHGSPGSRLMCPDIDATTAAGVRLITVDRPGYGGSDPAGERDLPDFVADAECLLDQLAVDVCPVIGWSGGGPYAIACGWSTAQRFVRIGLVASPGPELEMPAEDSGLTEKERDLYARVARGDQGVIEEVRSLYSAYADNPLIFLERALAAEDNPDRHVLQRPDVTDAFRSKWVEGARQGSEGLVADWRATAMGWGFPLSEVRVPVHIWHGGTDRIVPVTHAHYLAEGLPGASLTVFPGEGHSVAITHWGEVLAAIA